MPNLPQACSSFNAGRRWLNMFKIMWSRWTGDIEFSCKRSETYIFNSYQCTNLHKEQSNEHFYLNIFRSVKYFNAKGAFHDRHTIKATSKGGKEVRKVRVFKLFEILIIFSWKYSSFISRCWLRQRTLLLLWGGDPDIQRM